MTAPDAAGQEGAPGRGPEPGRGGASGPPARPGPARSATRTTGGTRGLAVRDADALIFAADMYGVQLDQLALLTGGERSARAAAARWRELGYAEMTRLSTGPSWVWVTRSGLAACGLRYQPAEPALSRLAHIRAVAAARIALEATSGYRRGAAYWRCERRIRARHGVGVRQHLPDGEVHWPDAPAPATGATAPATADAPPVATVTAVSQPHGTAGWAPVAWAGECWAVEAELSPKTVARTTAIMREILSRTGDYGGPVAEVSVPGQPPRHARVLYLCSPAALGTVLRARDALGPLGARVEVRDLPPGAALR
jgi:hypothetical protein